MSEKEDSIRSSFEQLESAVDIKYDDHNKIENESLHDDDNISFDPEDKHNKPERIYMNGPSGESSTDEQENHQNNEVSHNRDEGHKDGTNSFEMKNVVNKIKGEGSSGACFVNSDFEVNKNKTTIKNDQVNDEDTRDNDKLPDRGLENDIFSNDDGSTNNGELRVDNNKTYIHGHDTIDTEEESESDYQDLNKTVKPNLNIDFRKGERNNSMSSSRSSVNSGSSEIDKTPVKDKQNQSTSNQDRTVNGGTWTRGNSHLSGTGKEFVRDDDVKIEVPIQTDDSSYRHDKEESEVDENDGYDYEDEDIWALPEFRSEEKPWSELTRKEKIIKVLWHYIGKGILLIFLLYIFICSLSFLGDAFKLLGGKAAGKAFTNIDILSNRLAGVIIGVLATVLLQSSSTTTSIVVSMVGSGSLLTVRQAIPIIMGANIGTTITNTIVAVGQINHKEDFRRAFAGATVHDVFNWLSVLVMLLLEEIFGYLEAFTGAIVKNFEPGETSGSDNDYLKALTDPFTKLIIQIDKKVITRIATGNITGDGLSIIKHKCGKSTCKFIFEHVSSREGGGWSDEAIGVILLLISLFLLCLCLIFIVKILHSLLKGQIAKWIRKFINANLPGKLSYFTGYIALLIGAGITILVQSSSIFTSSLTPLVGMGVLSLDRMYPLTLGSNIGTTGTGIIAAFAQDPNQMKDALQIALCHLFFNITGILLFYLIPFMRLPIRAAKFLGTRSAEYRWFAVLYIIFPYFVLPALGLGLSLIHIALLITVLVLVAVIVLVIVVIKVLQAKVPRLLPQKLRNWKWLPEWMRSLEPTDRLIQRVLKRLGRLKLFVYCRKHCPCKKCKSGYSDDD